MKAYYVKQGDEFLIPLVISLDGTALDDTTVSKVEVTVGHHLRKTWPGDIVWNDEAGWWTVPLTQEETMEFYPGAELSVDVRAKLTIGSVLGTVDPMRLRVIGAASGKKL